MANTQSPLLQELERATDSHDIKDLLSVLFRREISYSSNKVAKSIKIMRRMQLDDMEKASRLMLMASEIQTKVHEKNNFIARLRLD
ncbi:hypothetical protein Tco_0469135 [Tanacetum coccineum]